MLDATQIQNLMHEIWMLVEFTLGDQPTEGAHIYDDDDSVDVHCQNMREKSSNKMNHLSGMMMLLDFHHHRRQTLLLRKQQHLNHIHQIKLQRELIILRVAAGTSNCLRGKNERIVGS